MNLRESAEMALEALELTKKSWDWVNPKILDSITALRTTLAEAEELPRREPLTDLTKGATWEQQK